MASGETSDCVQINSACHRTIIPAGEVPQSAYFMTEIVPQTGSERLSANVVFVVDRSGAVIEECLPGLKGALRDLIDRMRPEDSLALVSMSGQVIIPAQTVQQPSVIKRQLDRLSATTEAHTSAGLEEGLRQARINAVPDRASRLVFILGNETQEDPQKFYQLADQAAALDIPITGVGVGSAWSESFLAELTGRSILAAQRGLQGHVEHIPTPDDLVNIAAFVFPCLWVVGTEMTLKLLMARGIEVLHVWQVQPRVFELKNLPVKGALYQLPHQRLLTNGYTFLIEALITPRASGTARVLQTDLSFTLPNGTPARLTQDLTAVFSPETAGTNPLNSSVMDYVEAIQVYRLNIEGLADLQTGNRSSASKKLRQSAAFLTSQGRTALADRIRGEADYNIRQYGQVSNEGRKLITFASQHTALPE